MPQLQLDSIVLDLPAGWSTSALMMHVDAAPIGNPPFVPTLVLARRPEVLPGDSLDEVLARDLETFEAEQPSFRLREQEKLKFGKIEGRAIEFDIVDARGLKLRQRSVIRWVGNDLYIVTATAPAGADFAPVRTGLMKLAESLSPRT